MNSSIIAAVPIKNSSTMPVIAWFNSNLSMAYFCFTNILLSSTPTKKLATKSDKKSMAVIFRS